MPLDWTPFVDFVDRHQRFLVTTHIRPDGDGLGSMIGLAEVLQAKGKSSRLLLQPGMPNRYRFLDPQQRFEKFIAPGDSYRDAQAVIILDTGTWNQLADFGVFLKSLNVPRAVIDHHLTQDDLDAIRLVDPAAEATGRLVHDAVQALGGPLTETAANALYVALAMDTGWFRFSNTTADTLALASALVRAGAKTNALYDQLFENNPLGRLKLIGIVLDRLQVVLHGKVAYTQIHLADYEKTGAHPQDTEDMVNFTRSVEGVEVGVIFLEQPRGGIKVSFRSRRVVDVARLAEQFGGGGHKFASGAVVDAPMADAKKRVLDAVESALALASL